MPQMTPKASEVLAEAMQLSRKSANF